MGNQERNQYIDALRGIAIFMVVLGHTMTGCAQLSEDSFLFNVIWSVQMPLFMLISGYLNRYAKPIQTGWEMMEFVKRKSIAYMLPWFSWTFLVRGIIFQQKDFLNIGWLAWHMDSGYWFLFSLWTISMIFGTARFFAWRFSKAPGGIKELLFMFLLYGAGMVLLGMIGMAAGMSFLGIKLTLYYMPFYFAGYLFGRIQGTKRYLRSAVWLDVAAA